MARRTLLALVTASLLGAGCGTIGNLNRPAIAPADNPTAPVCKIYGGLRNDVTTMLDYPWSGTTFYLDYVLVPVLAVADLVLDAFGDTFTLPIAAVKATYRAIEGPNASPGVATPQAAEPAAAQSPATP